jgi:hypothetical protein
MSLLLRAAKRFHTRFGLIPYFTERAAKIRIQPSNSIEAEGRAFYGSQTQKRGDIAIVGRPLSAFSRRISICAYFGFQHAVYRGYNGRSSGLIIYFGREGSEANARGCEDVDIVRLAVDGDEERI